MKSILFLGILLFSSLFALCQELKNFEGTKIYLVRHAEKDTGKNPSLIVKGFERAGDLMRKLEDKNITLIFSTDTKRTLQTADSIKLLQSIPLIKYVGDTTGNDLVQKIIENNAQGKTILVIGHSNTIPKLIRKLGVSNYNVQNLGDTEFDKLFLLIFKKKKIKFKQMSYGKVSTVSAKMN